MSALIKFLSNIFKKKNENSNFTNSHKLPKFNNKNIDSKILDEKAESYEDFIRYEKNYDLVDDFIVFDFETTGLNAQENRIIQIGAIRYRNNQNVEIFNTYINPQVKIPHKITEITGITNTDVKNAPTIDKVLPEFLSFIRDDVLIAHNVDFDMKFLQTNMYNLRMNKLKNKVIDTLSLARKYIKDIHGKKLSSYKLENLKEILRVDAESHNALDDCLTCAEVYKKCKENYKIFKNTRIIKDDEIGNIERKCFEIIKEILKRNNRDIKYVKHIYIGKYFDIQAFYSLIRIKFRGRKQYILSKHTEKEIKKVWKDAMCENAVKSETGITRILFNYPDELFKLENLIVQKFDECMKDIEIYRQNVACGEKNVQEYLNS